MAQAITSSSSIKRIFGIAAIYPATSTRIPLALPSRSTSDFYDRRIKFLWGTHNEHGQAIGIIDFHFRIFLCLRSTGLCMGWRAALATADCAARPRHFLSNRLADYFREVLARDRFDRRSAQRARSGTVARRKVGGPGNL